MQVVSYPIRADWPKLLARPSSDMSDIDASVRRIISAVKAEGDTALRDLTKRYDGVEVCEIAVAENEIASATERVPLSLKLAIQMARTNIEKFHRSQQEERKIVDTSPGVRCWRKSVAIERVGFYIPAGSAPLFSTVLMLAVPAKIAGCSEIVMCSPPDAEGRIDDAVLFTADLCGVTRIFKVGGAQAIAAMAHGTKTIPRVFKIFGPGNRYVTYAKQLVSTDVAIDMPAGPSEVAVLADKTCDPRFVAADLLSQAEHGTDSQVLLVTPDQRVIDETLAEIESQLKELPRREIAEKALVHSTAILVRDKSQSLDLLNEYAPEHLILAVEDADEMAERVVNAGSVFIGNYSCESAGDYAAGTNHTLPTAGFARSHGGVSLDSFVKKITFQKVSPAGILDLGPAIEVMAAAEGLEAHKRAVSVRLEEINGV